MAYSHNGDFERLVEQITDVIVARVTGRCRHTLSDLKPFTSQIRNPD